MIFLHLWVVQRPQKHDKSTNHNNSSNTQGSIAEIYTPPYTACLKILFKALFTFTFPRRAAILYAHLISLSTLDPLNAPYQLHTAITYASTTSLPLPQPHIIALASRTIITRLPPPTRYHRFSQALIALFVHVFVILQIELTIKWNNITDLGGVGNVGQLIPLLVGVGGLALVAARGVEGVCKGVKVWESDGGKEEGNREWNTFVAAYEEWKVLCGESRYTGI
jgi:hypothetical protein